MKISAPIRIVGGLILAIMLVPAQAVTTRTWTGAASNLWSNAGNWNPAGVPVSGDTLMFPLGAANYVNNNDLVGLSLAGLQMGISTSPTYTFNGNAIQLTGDFQSYGGTTLNFPIDIRKDGALISYPGNPFIPDNFNGKVDVNANGVHLNSGTFAGGLDTHANSVNMNALAVTGTLVGNGALNIGDVFFADTVGFNGIISGSNSHIYLNNATLPFATISGNALMGSGTVAGPVTVYSISAAQVDPRLATVYGSTLLPNSTGTLNTGSLTLSLSGVTARINGSTPGTGYSQINVTGAVSLGNLAGLYVTMDPNFTPTVGQQFVLINNDGNDPISGTFNNLPEKSTVTINGIPFILSYMGGDGNDVTLTRKAAATTSVTSTPNPSVFGFPVTYTATVIGNGTVPTGTLTFYDGNASLGSVSLAGGLANLQTTATAIGTRTIRADYGGDANYAPSSGTLAGGQLVQQAGVTRTWSGAINGQWSNAGNWNPVGAPASGDKLFFPAGATTQNVTNDLAGLRVNGITVGASGYTFNGNGFILGGPFTTNGNNTFNMPIDVQTAIQLGNGNFSDVFAGHLDINSSGVSIATVKITGGIDVHAYGLSALGISSIAGPLSGSGPISGYSIYGGSIIYGGTGTYSGTISTDLYLNGGVLPNASANRTIFGNGTLGAVSGWIYPAYLTGVLPYEATGPGVLNTGNLQISTLAEFILAGDAPGNGYSQANVTGNVTIAPSAGVTIRVAPDFAPAIGQQFILVKNDGNDPISGTFSSMPEGSLISANSAQYRLSYIGGDGNDITLTALSLGAAAQTIDFPNPGPQSSGLDLRLRATASSGLFVVFSSLTPSVCYVNEATASFFTTVSGICTIAANQGGDATYAPAPVVTQSFTVSAAAPMPQTQTIFFDSIAAQIVGIPLNLIASASSALPVTFSSLTTSVCTVSGNVASFAAAGTCTIAADQSGSTTYFPAPRVTQSFSVNAQPQTQTITFSNPGARTVGVALNLFASASSSLPVTFSSLTTSVCTVTGIVAFFVTTGTCTIAADQSGNASYSAAPRVTQTFAVNAAATPQAQTINFANPGAQTVGAGFTFSATASSGLAVTFSSLTASVCAVSGASVSLLAAGSCTIAADQSGNASYSAAPRVTQTFAVNAAASPQAQTITFANPGNKTVGGSLNLTATASSGLPVTFSSQTTPVCTITNGVASFVAAGTCTIAADQGGNASYAAAQRVMQSFTVSAAQTATTVIVTSSANPSVLGQSVTFTAGIPLLGSPAATGTITFTDGGNTLGTGTLNGGLATFTTNTLGLGTHVIGASYPGDAGHLSGSGAMANSQVVNATAAANITLPLITFPMGTIGVAYPSLTFQATGGTAPYTYMVSTGALPTGMSLTSTGTLGGTPTATGIFNLTLIATDAHAITGSRAYSITIGQRQTITFTNPGAQLLGASVNLVASASSGLPVTLASFTPSICSVSAGKANLLSIGNCTVTADQAGDSSYTAAQRVSQTFAVNAAPSVPGAPTNLVCTGGVGQAVCTFTPPANNGGSVISVYTVACSSRTGPTGVTRSGAGNTSPVTVGNLGSGTTWSCTVIAHNITGDSVSSAAAADITTVQTLSVPPAPIVNRAIAGNGNAIVGFTPLPNNGGAPVTRYTASSTPGGINAGCNVPCNAIVVNGLTNGASYTFTVTATNSVGTGPVSNASNAVTPLASNSSGPPVPPIAQRGAGIDIDGSGKGQILLRSSGGLYQAGRLVNNQLQFTAISNNNLSANFRVIALGDFNSDGKTDIALQNTTQGEFGDVVIYYGSDFTTAPLTVRSVKLVWLVQAIADMDGDGNTDMVFRFTGDDGVPNDTGVSYIWFMDGNNVTKVRKRGGAPLGWTLLGASDINGDLAADMIYVDPSNNLRALMATPQRTCANLSAGSLPTGATALKLAEFTGVGNASVLSRNTATGSAQLLTMDGSSLTLPTFTDDPEIINTPCTSSNLQIPTIALSLPNVDPAWQFYAAGDLNGDGYTDIVWLLPDGSLTIWLMGANTSSPTVISNAGTPPSGYSVLQP